MTTDVEYALMAGHAYRTTRDPINWFPVPQGWIPFFPVPDPTTTNAFPTTSGFEAVSFIRGSDIVISFAGTYQPDVFGDWKANSALATGFGSKQLVQAAEYYLQVKAANPNTTITLTGHSLGGGLAALIGVFFGVETFAFDQAPFALSAEAVIDPQRDSVGEKLLAELLAIGHSAAELSALTGFLELQESDGGVPNSNLVNNIRVEGEFNQAIPLGTVFDTIGNSPRLLTHGPYLSPSADMHAQSLLTAFLQSEQSATQQQTLSEVTKKLTALLPMIFRKSLFSRPTVSGVVKARHFGNMAETGGQDAMMTG